MKYVFHPEALTEYSQAVEFYAERNKELAQDFIDSVESAIFKVIEFPRRCPVIKGTVCRCLTRKFPYAVLYAIEEDYILIVAVMHGSKKPEYWQQRIKLLPKLKLHLDRFRCLDHEWHPEHRLITWYRH